MKLTLGIQIGNEILDPKLFEDQIGEFEITAVYSDIEIRDDKYYMEKYSPSLVDKLELITGIDGLIIQNYQADTIKESLTRIFDKVSRDRDKIVERNSDENAEYELSEDCTLNFICDDDNREVLSDYINQLISERGEDLYLNDLVHYEGCTDLEGFEKVLESVYYISGDGYRLIDDMTVLTYSLARVIRN